MTKRCGCCKFFAPGCDFNSIGKCKLLVCNYADSGEDRDPYEVCKFFISVSSQN